MRKFICHTGETAYVFTDGEIEVLRLLIEKLQLSLPSKEGEIVNG